VRYVSESDVKIRIALSILFQASQLAEALARLQQYRKVKDVLRLSGCLLGPAHIVEICNGHELAARLDDVGVPSEVVVSLPFRSE
jgi:hypothetical protein